MSDTSHLFNDAEIIELTKRALGTGRCQERKTIGDRRFRCTLPAKHTGEHIGESQDGDQKRHSW